MSVNSVKEIEDPVERIKAKLWGYQIATRFTIRDGLWSLFNRYEMNCDVMPMWFQLMAVQHDDGRYAKNFIDDKFPEEVRIKAFELFEIDEDIENIGYNLDTIYKALADDNPKIRTYVNDIGHIPIEISAMAVKALNIPAAIYQVKEGGDVIYNDDIVYKIVTDDTDEIRGAVLINLYKVYSFFIVRFL